MHFFSVPREAGFMMQLLTDLLHNTAGIGAGTGGGELGEQG